MILRADARAIPLADSSVHCVVTSPPYWGLRDYGTARWEGGDAGCNHQKDVKPSTEHVKQEGYAYAFRNQSSRSNHAEEPHFRDTCRKCGARRVDAQLGLERTPEEYVANMVAVFREVRRVLREDGVCFVNLGDSYATSGGGAYKEVHANPGISNSALRSGSDYSERKDGLKPKDLVGIPWRVAFALQADGWYLRSDIIWAKPNPMPESVTDRPTKAHEYIFLLSKSARYFFDQDAVKEESVYPGDTRHLRTDTRKDIDPMCRDNGSRFRTGNPTAPTRNLRSVWTMATEPFSDWTKTVHWPRVEAGDVSGGMRRITSADCPVHGDHRRMATTGGYDPHGDDSETRIARSDGGHEQEPSRDFAPTGLILLPSFAGCNSDSQSPTCAHAATDRSTQTHRTDHDPSTNQPCTSFARTLDHTERTGESPAGTDSADRTFESSTLPDGLDDHLWGEIPFHTVNRSSLPIPPLCLCGYYHRITKEASHFATFPTELAKRCILAGTSERGCCAVCGAPWRRVVESSKEASTRSARGKAITSPRQDGSPCNENSGRGFMPVSYTTTGWAPTCSHDAPTVPCTVLDPFAGSGTTESVAQSLGRRGISLELSAPYCQLARKRLRGTPRGLPL